jgi:hypothetical protein
LVSVGAGIIIENIHEDTIADELEEANKYQENNIGF